ncbi:MAG TPA: hypothetical protein PLD88_11335, partial [Candidatus Berkiella sp.]|nr:hypothetical protein [Candidatus Berkiella sp.]
PDAQASLQSLSNVESTAISFHDCLSINSKLPFRDLIASLNDTLVHHNVTTTDTFIIPLQSHDINHVITTHIEIS